MSLTSDYDHISSYFFKFGRETGFLWHYNASPGMKQRLFLLYFLFFLAGKSSSQGYMITAPRLEFDGSQLLIYYDIITKHSRDQFFVWVEIVSASGEKIPAMTLS